MYDNHVPTIAAAMRADPDTFVRGCMFAILSIRTQVITVPDQMRDLEREGVESKYLLAHKRDAYRYLTTHKVQLWSDVCAATDTAEVIQILCKVPGLGIVKAAFIAQFVGFDIACLDTRNIVRDGRDWETYRTRGPKSKQGPAFARKVARYVADTGGRAREYWDAWCIDVAGVYGWTAEAISKLHLDVIVPAGLAAGVVAASVPLYGTPDVIPF